MKKLLLALAATSALVGTAHAQDAITGFNIGILGGENAQDRMTNLECFRAKVEAELGVPTKLFTPADYDGVIQGLLGGTLDFAWLGASAYAKTYLTAALPEIWLYALGALFVGVTLFLPKGIVGLLGRLKRRTT